MGLLSLIRKPAQEKLKSIADAEENQAVQMGSNIVLQANQLLTEVSTDLNTLDAIKLPIDQIALLGAGVASMLPALRTVTQTVTANSTGMYRLANAAVGDSLKLAKDGSFWGALKSAGGKSKMAKLVSTDSVSTTATATMPINPATIMMAAALVSIEQKLDAIAETQKQILSFLEAEKEAQIEGDIKTLMGMIQKYKYNWNNSEYTSNHHKQVLDIKRSAEQNIILYQKQVAGKMHTNSVLFFNPAVTSTKDNLEKSFHYYRLSLYTYAFSSFLEVMLLGNFNSDYIAQVSSKIRDYAYRYREFYTECYNRLEQLAQSSIESSVLKGLGSVAKAMGNLIGNTPMIKDGPVDEWLIQSGVNLEHSASDHLKQMLIQFAEIRDPGCTTFIENLNYIDRIYNQTADLCFDKYNIYLVKLSPEEV